MKKNPRTKEQLLAENENLRRRLDEAEETLRAIHEGEVDALVLSKPQGDVVFTLKGAEHPYRVFVEAMNEGAATLDPEGTILYCNNRFAEMLKMPPDKVIGSSVRRFIPSTDTPGFESAFEGGKQEDTTVDISLKREDQELIPVHLSFNMLPGQEMPVLCMVAMDLTEHKRLEEALRQLNTDLEKRVQNRTAELMKVNETLQESEQRWATTLASIGDAVIATCEDGKIRFMNAVAEELTGWTLSEASQKPVKQVFKIINEHTRLEVEDPVGKVIETGMICGLANHTLLVRKDGTEVAIDDSGAPIRDETGKTMGVVLVFRDITERRRADEALAESEQRYRGIVETTEEGIATYEPDGTITYVNQRMADMLGYSREEMIGRSSLDFVDDEEREAVIRARESLKERGSFSKERKLRRKDGSVLWTLSNASPRRDGAGNFLGYLAMYTDITARKQAEEALRESDQRFRLALHNAPVSVAAQDRDLRYIWAYNQRTARPEEIVGKLDSDIFTPEEAAHVTAIKRRVIEENVELREQMWFNRPSGRIFLDICWEPICDASGRVTGVASATVDLTPIKFVEEALRKNEERFRIAEQLAKMGHFEWDVVNNVIVASSSLERIYGLEPGGFKGRYEDWLTMVYSEERTRVYEIVQSAFAEKRREERFEFRILRPEGDVRWISIQATATYDESGRPLRVMGAMTDITDIKKAQEELRKSHDELEKRVQERTSELAETVERLRAENIARKQLEDTLRQSEYQVRFFASQCLTAQETERRRVAGELHDSIAASLGAMKFKIDKILEEMNQGHASPESLQDLGLRVTEINNEVRRIMADLRPSILDDLGIIPALSWFCREYQKTYSHICVENQIGTLEQEVPDSLKTPIFRISQEAMNNIAKHSQASLLTLSLRKDDDKIELKITDNGKGFDVDTVKKGMGLSTMKERAQLSGGSFDLESAVGKGTIIRVSWPC